MLEKYTEAQLKSLMDVFGCVPVTTTLTSLATCCGTSRLVTSNNEFYNLNTSRINFTFTTEDTDIPDIPPGWESLVIPDTTGNLSLYWKEPT